MNKVGEGIKGILCGVCTYMVFRGNLRADFTREEVGKDREKVVQRLKGDCRRSVGGHGRI